MKVLNSVLGWIFISLAILTGLVVFIPLFIYFVSIFFSVIVSLLPFILCAIPILLFLLGIWFLEKEPK